MIQPDELLFTVDETNSPLHPQPRTHVHKEQLWHRTSHIWVINVENHALCHQRSLLKDIAPGTWQPFFGGHLAPNTSYLDGALSELQEEMGIAINKDKLEFFDVYKCDKAKEFVGIFLYEWNGDVQTIPYEKEEVEQIMFMHPEKLAEVFSSPIENLWCTSGYEKDMISFIQNRNNPTMIG